MTDLFEAETATTTTLDMRRLQRNKRRATRRKWTVLVSVVAIVVFAIGASVAWNFVGTFKTTGTEIADYEGSGQGTLQIVIDPGDTGADIATTLADAGVVASRQAFLQEWNANADSASIVPGYYWVHREMKAQFALQSLLDPGTREVRTVTVTEGSNLATFAERIAAITGATDEEVKAAMEDTDALGLPASEKGKLEGWLFPARYEFDPGVTPQEVLSTMVARTIQQLDTFGVAEADRHDILTIASLIEREARLDEDRPKVASVIYNRLAKDMPLELDSTIKYYANSEGVLTSDEERADTNPYNTYLYAGLPPGPIASPGAAAIEAAVKPADTKYLFFVTVNTDTGETKYAQKYPQHQKNVKEFQKWYRDNN